MSLRGEEKVFQKYVQLMMKSINPDIDPRQDFMGYACGRFNLQNYDRTQGEYPPNRFGDPFDRILENENLTQPALVKARNFYQSYENDVTKIFQSESLTEFCGGFPAFFSEWTAGNFDWIKASALLSAMAMHTVINYSVRYANDSRVLQISAEIPDEEIVASAETVLKQFGMQDEEIASVVASVEIVREKSREQAPKSSEQELREKLFAEFFAIATGVSLTDKDTIEMDDYDVSYIKGLLNIFEEIEPKVVANYIMCCAIHKHGEDNIFTNPHELTMNYFAPAMISAAFESFWTQEEETRRDMIRSRYIASLKGQSEKLGINSIGSANCFFYKDKEVTDYIMQNFPASVVESDFEGLEILRDNFVQNILNLMKYGTSSSVKTYFSQNYPFEDMQLKIISFLQDLVNTNNKPTVFHFSGNQVELWSEVVDVCKLQQTKVEYKVLPDAICAQMITLDIPEDDNLVKSCARTVIAIKFAFEDYKNWLTDNSEMAEQQKEFLKSFNLTNNQLFFVSFAQHFCGVDHLSANLPLLITLNSEELKQEFGIVYKI